MFVCVFVYNMCVSVFVRKNLERVRKQARERRDKAIGQRIQEKE